MPTSKPSIGKRVKVPDVMLEKFKTEMRILKPAELVGIWPIDPGLLRDQDFIKKLLNDKKFTENYEIAIIAKS